MTYRHPNSLIGRQLTTAASASAARSAIDAISATEVENIVGNYETETLALFNRMTVRPDANNRTAINSLIKALKTSGIWAKLDGLYLLAAHTPQAGLLNWKADARNLIAYNSATVEANYLDGNPITANPTFTANQGFTGDGVASYLMTNSFSGAGLLMAQNDETLGAWVRTNPAEANSVVTLGQNSGGSGSIRFFNSNGSANANKVVWRSNWTATSRSGGLSRNTSGAADNLLVACSRTGATASYQYANGVLDDSSTEPSGTDTRAQTFWLSIGRNSSAYSTRQHSAAFYGRGLSDNEHAILYNSLRDYMIGVGAV
jgi:hypothetical protein